ncbi:MAG: hypothetical protein AAF383_10275 [Cyanobacteria bacterium P01_A01_bin.83]
MHFKYSILKQMIIKGTPENDNFVGTALDDSITGAGGDDKINGGLGDDTLLGGIGDDRIRFDAGQKVVNGGPGDDFLFLNFSNESEDFVFTYNQFETASPTVGGVLDGTEVQGIEQISVTSGSGDDLIDIAVTNIGGRITSGAGNDLVVGGSGDDLLEGQAGDDTFFGGPGNDEIVGGALGNDAAVYVGLASDYEVAIDDDGAATVTGVALENFPEEDADLSEAEVFTDNLTDVEIILFDDGEIIVETGEFIPFPPDAEEDEEDEEDIVNGSASAEIDPDEEIEVYEFFRTDTQTQFFTTDENERDEILENLPQYELEGVSFVGAAPTEEGEDITGQTPVYRFFNNTSGVHLYTADENEKTFIEENLDNYTLEGTPYYGFDAPGEDTVPVYRFYNASLDAHFYTISSTERDSFIESPDYQTEGATDGIAFYVEPPSDS